MTRLSERIARRLAADGFAFDTMPEPTRYSRDQVQNGAWRWKCRVRTPCFEGELVCWWTMAEALRHPVWVFEPSTFNEMELTVQDAPMRTANHLDDGRWFIRASHLCQCVVCGKQHIQHPQEEVAGTCGLFLHRVCGGLLVKL